MKYHFICLLLSFIFLHTCYQIAEGKMYIPVQYKSYINTTNEIKDYSAELKDIELFLFHRIYYNETNLSRIYRIEKYLFRRNYLSMSIDERMDNILKTYDNPQYYNRNNKLKSAFMRNIVGIPTGVTPPIYPNSPISPIIPFKSNILNNGFYSNTSNFGNNHTYYRYYY